MPREVTVRAETPADALAVRAVNERAFGGALEADIVAAVREAVDSISLVAVLREQIVGHILFTPVRIDPPTSARVAGLAPMAVSPDAQRRGIGSALVRAGLEECRREGYGAVVVLGHPDYYPRFGFRQADHWRLACEYDAPPEAFMALELEPGVLDAGTVIYRPEFSI
jgi:putative acetyltransferase